MAARRRKSELRPAAGLLRMWQQLYPTAAALCHSWQGRRLPGLLKDAIPPHPLILNLLKDE